MKTLIAFVGLLVSTSAVHAACVGSGAVQSCYDPQSGNSYNIQRLGNTTFMQGSNLDTGSTWSQQSTTIGRTTFNSGIDKDGDGWSTTCVNGFCN